MNENLLDAVAQSHKTQKNKVREGIESIAQYCCQLQGFEWDEIVAFFAASAVLNTGYSDIFSD